jgi:hypothetical protein
LGNFRNAQKFRLCFWKKLFCAQLLLETGDGKHCAAFSAKLLSIFPPKYVSIEGKSAEDF